jgi:hypothetical protein
MQHHLSPRAGSNVATVVLFAGSMIAAALVAIAYAVVLGAR